MELLPKLRREDGREGVNIMGMGMLICKIGVFGSITIGLLFLAIAILSRWEWAYRAAIACGVLLLLFIFWIQVLIGPV